MSEAEAAAPERAATAGSLLREARQASGMHIAALAVSLKVPVAKLEALEADNYAALRDTVFVRALASSMCRTLKVDPAPILALLPQSQSPRLATSTGLNAPVRTAGGKLSSASSSTSYAPGVASRPITWVVLALLVGAAALFVYPRMQWGGGGEPSTPASTPAAPAMGEAPSAADAALPAAVPAEAPVPQPPSGAGQGDVAAQAAPATAPANAAAPAAAAAPSAAPAAAGSSGADASAPPGGVLVLRARSQSWVQVRDAAGTVVLQRNLASGETVSLGAPPPLSVVVGRADATEVFVRGKPFDLAGLSRDNVARFEVK